MHNKGVNYFEECLTLGQWMGQEDRRALYKYLAKSKRDSYKTQAGQLLSNGSLFETVANGEIKFMINGRSANYVARKLGLQEFTPVIREINLFGPKFYKKRILQKFFAQSEVDIIYNFPLPGVNKQNESSFNINTYPFYDLSYYSDGKSRLLGLIKKLRTDDKEIVMKLGAL